MAKRLLSFDLLADFACFKKPDVNEGLVMTYNCLHKPALLGILPIVFIQYSGNVWVGVGLISLAAAAHQAWSANIFTTASDMFPKRAVSSVVGIGGSAGSIGGILFPFLIGAILDHFKLLGNINTGYNIIFIICGSAYMVAWLLMHLLAPRMEEVKIM